MTEMAPCRWCGGAVGGNLTLDGDLIDLCCIACGRVQVEVDTRCCRYCGERFGIEEDHDTCRGAEAPASGGYRSQHEKDEST